MAGTTRFGYSGGGKDGGDEGRAPGAPGKATVFGRDAHLLRPRSAEVEPAPPAPAAASLPPGPSPAPAEAPAARLPSRSGKSGFPARAGFWGRRNTHGELEPAAGVGLEESEDELNDHLKRRPLPPLARHALVVLASAALSFLAVLLALKLREPAPAPADKAAAAPTGGDRPGPPQPAPAAPSSPPPSAAAPAPTTRPAGVPPRRPKGARPARRASVPQSPGDRVLPPSFRAP